MALPKGWEESDPCAGDSNRPVACGSCDWKGDESDVPDGLWEVDDIHDRVESGDIVPAGICPAEADPNVGVYACRSLVFYSDVEIVYRKVLGVLDKIVEAVEQAD